MAAKGSWTPAKIFLVVLAVLAGLLILCCGAGWLLVGDKVVAGFKFGIDSTEFVQELRTEFGGKSGFALVNDDRNAFTLTIAVEGELTPEKVVEAQDKTWKIVSEVFAENGFFPIAHVAIGEPGTGPGENPQPMNWSQNMVSIEDLEKRTGISRPKTVAFLPDELGADVRIQVKSKEGDGEADGK
jgi:hypothetical protein